jgi:hypothetical protein
MGFIEHGEPAPDLFVVPDTYKVTDDKGREIPGTRKTARQ